MNYLHENPRSYKLGRENITGLGMKIKERGILVAIN